MTTRQLRRQTHDQSTRFDMAHLKLHSSGHLTLHSTGHLKLWSESTTYNSQFAENVYWGGDAVNEHSIWDLTTQQIIDLIDSAIANYADYGGGMITGGLVGISAGNDWHGWAVGWVHARGTIYEIYAVTGTFSSPKGTLQITTGPPYSSTWSTSESFYKVGTGSTKPTGDPQGWSGNIVSNGTSNQTINNQALQRYVWIACESTKWYGLGNEADSPRGRETSLSLINLVES